MIFNFNQNALQGLVIAVTTLAAPTLAHADLEQAPVEQAPAQEQAAPPQTAPTTDFQPAPTVPQAAPAVVSAPAPAKVAPPRLEIGGYGELQFNYFRYGANQNLMGGAQADNRLVFDTTRFVAELTGDLGEGFRFESEIEFEHGGTGSAMELEYDEFGEFESEVEKGGEVVVEELFVSKDFSPNVTVSAGRMYVGLGTLWHRNRPDQYLAVTRSEAETTFVPGVWHEMGAEVNLHWPTLRVLVQIVNGLDSTGFSSRNFIAGGHQTRFELVSATDLALVSRVDIRPFDGVEVGVAGYLGDTARNRPKADLVPRCTSTEASVAPCGYMRALLFMGDVHWLVERGPWLVNGMIGFGHLQNADAISERNERLSNALGVSRTPVADNALSMWTEVGYSFALTPTRAITPFARFDFVDTMVASRSELFDNPRFERWMVTAGARTMLGNMIAKLDAKRRWFGSSDLRAETSVELGLGFTY